MRKTRPQRAAKTQARDGPGSNDAVHTHFVFSRGEYDALCQKAKQCGMSRSAFLRRLITGQPIKARPPEALHDLYVEINRIGVNVNQIARACNAGGSNAKASADKALFMLGKVYTLMDKLASG